MIITVRHFRSPLLILGMLALSSASALARPQISSGKTAPGAAKAARGQVAPLPKAQLDWNPIGPGGGGWLTSITVVDDPAGTVYVCCDVGGIYKSVDHGATWELKNQGLSIYYVEDIAYDPMQPSTLFAGTRGGVFKSTDGGDHWVSKRVGFPPVSEFAFSAPISDILVDPLNPSIVYAGVGVPRAGYEQLDSYAWVSSETKGAIYKSVDAGESWTLIQGTGIDPSAMVYSLAIDPNDSNVLYAATSTGVYKSTNAGTTWLLASAGLPHLLALTLVVDPIDSNILFVTIWEDSAASPWLGGVYKSVNAGASWTAKNNGLQQVFDSDPGFTSNYPVIAINPQNPDILYVGHSPYTPDPGVFKSLDGGDSWALVSHSEPPGVNMDFGWIVQHGPFARCLALDPNNPDRVFLGSPTHLFRTEDGGAFWDQAYTQPVGSGYWKGNGMETTVVQDIAVDPSNSDNLYAGYWDMGFLKSVDGGDSFKRTYNGMTYDSNTFSVVVDPARTNVIYAATGRWEENQGEVCKSTDYGENWVPQGNGMPDAQIWSLALDLASPTNQRTLYATSYGNGIYRSTDDAQTWFPINNGLGVSGNLQARTVCIDPNNSNVLYAGFEELQIETASSNSTVQGGLFKSTNAGQSWTRMDSRLPQLSVWDIEVAPQNSQVIYVAVGGGYDHSAKSAYPGGVYKSTDGGLSWRIQNQGFGDPDNLKVVFVEFAPGNSKTIYAVTRDSPFHDQSSGRGIFQSTDSGKTWQAINAGLDVLYFNVLTVDPSNPSVLYAGSGGNGILKRDGLNFKLR